MMSRGEVLMVFYTIKENLLKDYSREEVRIVYYCTVISLHQKDYN